MSDNQEQSIYCAFQGPHSHARAESQQCPGIKTVHWRHPSLGYQACGEAYSWDGITEQAAAVTCLRCLAIAEGTA